jgi:hypothetical protein
VYIKYVDSEQEYYDCEKMLGECDYVIKNERAEYFRGIYKRYLFLESGTGPYPRGLQIYDIIKKERVFITQFSKPIFIDEHGILTFWRTSENPQTAGKNDMTKWKSASVSMIIEEEVSMSLISFKITVTGETRIAPRQ